MANCENFQLLLHIIYNIMAKKKKTSTASSTSFKEALGIDKIFHNERLNFFLGFMLLFIASDYLLFLFPSSSFCFLLI